MDDSSELYLHPSLHGEVEHSWYKDAIIYEVHVRAFKDSDGDGIGDFRGLIERLDYIQGLGITALWILPFYPSPLRDDGYDIADYLDIHPDYGNLKDFRDLLKAAHSRGLKVITELVLNHTSSNHIWFQRARRAPTGSRVRDMYVWNDSPDKYRDARIIFKDFESSNWSWDAIAQQYYFHRFYSHQPDLNFNNPTVQRSIFRILDFWFSLGIDGMRLDAVPYLYEREGTNCENLPETHVFLNQLRNHIDQHFKDKMLLAEANQWPEDAVTYFGQGDECHMAFHFPLMPRMFMAIQMEDSFPIVDILKSTPHIPANCQWATFLRNHDELTLEMVTDEERDYMYRVYAKDTRAKINLGIRRRLAPLLSNDRRKIELMNILLFSLPGTPIIYYGDEIGMGDNYYLGDRNGVRTPMQWGPDKNAGFSDANPHQLYLPVIIDPEYHFQTINVQNQDLSFSSLLWWMKSVIATRKRFLAFSRGTFELLLTDNPKIFAFSRKYEDEILVVVTNLSRYHQVVNIDMPQYSGLVPEEIFGRSIFPIIKKTPYMLTLGPYDYYWLLLGKNREEIGVAEEKAPIVHVKKNWENIFRDHHKNELTEKFLPRYLMRSRWFGAKTRRIKEVEIVENLCMKDVAVCSHLLLLRVAYKEGADEHYLLPVSYTAQANEIVKDYPQSVITGLWVDEKEGLLFDGTYDENVHKNIYDIITMRKKFRGTKGEVTGFLTKEYRTLMLKKPISSISSRPLKVEQSNSAIMYDEILFLKLYRRLEGGTNPELDIMKFITERTSFKHIPPLAGALEYRVEKKEPVTLAILQGFVENSGNAWAYTSGMVTRYFEQALSAKENVVLPKQYAPLIELAYSEIPQPIYDMIGELFIEMMTLLGKRTAEMHLALSGDYENPEFSPEPFSQLYQRSLYQSMNGQVQLNFQQLEKRLNILPSNSKGCAENVIELQRRIVEILRKITHRKINATKIRVHGDYHLGQVLYTGKDFVIMDFEGEPARPLSERKLKRSPFKDVAGMIRSFHYAAYGALLVNTVFRSTDIVRLEEWVEPWFRYVSSVFIRAYLDTAKDAPFVPSDKDEVEILLQTFLLDKAVYELGYEMNNRPDWVIIPLKGILQVVHDASQQISKTGKKE